MKKIFTSILTLVLMTVVLGTGVYAWFTINTKTTADGLEGTAETAQGGFMLQVTEKDGNVDKDAWSTSVNLSEALTTLISDLEFTDVTTKNGDLTTLLNGLEENATTAEANKDYVEFDFHFLTGENRNNVYLTNLDIETQTETSWVSEVDLTYDGVEVKKGDVLKAKLSDAMRVSFTEGSSTTIFENEAGTTEISKSGTDVTFENTAGFGGFALDYYNEMMSSSINLPSYISDRDDKVLDASGEKLVTSTAHNGNIDFNLDETFTHYSVVTVRIWLEGWDAQAFNAVAGGSVTVNFEFEVKES